MSRRHTGHFYEAFEHLLKVIIVIRAYVVPPYGIRGEGRKEKKCFEIFSKDSHHDMQIMSRHHAE